jgi:hypothetical protein
MRRLKMALTGIYRVQALRRAGTAADWTAATTVLSNGEIGVETDTGNSKIGDGKSAWSALSYVNTSGAQSQSPSVTSVAGRTGDIILTLADITGAASTASPMFTGVPVAPTAAAGTATTQLATTAFVATAVTSAVAGIPGYVLPAATSSALGGVKQAAFMPGLAAAPTQSDFNGLLGKLIAAGLMSAS